MKKIILTTLLACTTTVMADQETISSELTKKFVETKPTVNLNHYSDSMVAGQVDLNTRWMWIDCNDRSRRCLIRWFENPFQHCGRGEWRTSENMHQCPRN